MVTECHLGECLLIPMKPQRMKSLVTIMKKIKIAEAKDEMVEETEEEEIVDSAEDAEIDVVMIDLIKMINEIMRIRVVVNERRETNLQKPPEKKNQLLRMVIQTSL